MIYIAIAVVGVVEGFQNLKKIPFLANCNEISLMYLLFISKGEDGRRK